MTDYVTVTCTRCGETFVAHPDANAAETGFCSPACASAADGT
ncbi:MAG: hypothetical protein ABEH40_01805 [Haloferacaceae archaeon]